VVERQAVAAEFEPYIWVGHAQAFHKCKRLCASAEGGYLPAGQGGGQEEGPAEGQICGWRCVSRREGCGVKCVFIKLILIYLAMRIYIMTIVIGCLATTMRMLAVFTGGS